MGIQSDIERKYKSEWVLACRVLEVVGTNGKRRDRKTWNECVKDDMKRLGLIREDALI